MIEFVNIHTGERRQLDRPHQIGAYINSSDLHVNSSKGQDFGWRLSEDIIVKVDEMREDIDKLEDIAKRIGVPTDELTTIHLVQQISYEQDVAKRLAERRVERDPAFKKDYEARIEALRAGEEKPAVKPVTSNKKK